MKKLEILLLALTISNLTLASNNYQLSDYVECITIKDSIPSQIRESSKNVHGYMVGINKNTQLLHIYNVQNLSITEIASYSISSGKISGKKQISGDNKTPEGNFKIISIEDSRNWTFQGEKAYGPLFLRLQTPWDGIGIHGTNEPHKLGTRASHGCIRLNNFDLVNIYANYISTGTPVVIEDNFNYKIIDNYFQLKSDEKISIFRLEKVIQPIPELPMPKAKKLTYYNEMLFYPSKSSSRIQKKHYRIRKKYYKNQLKNSLEFSSSKYTTKVMYPKPFFM